MNMLHQIFSWLLSSSLRGSLLALAHDVVAETETLGNGAGFEAFYEG